MAARLPKVIDAAAMPAKSSAQSTSSGSKAVKKTRMTTAKPAALLATERKAVTGVGAPS